MRKLSPDDRGSLHPAALAAFLDGSAQDRLIATAGLTPDQVAAVQRLVAWFTCPDALTLEQFEAHMSEMDELERIFPRRTS